MVCDNNNNNNNNNNSSSSNNNNNNNYNKTQGKRLVGISVTAAVAVTGIVAIA